MCLKDYNWEEFFDYFKQVRENCFDSEEVKNDFKSCTKGIYEKTVPKKT
jgi:hypothetical protein